MKPLLEEIPDFIKEKDTHILLPIKEPILEQQSFQSMLAENFLL